MNGAHIARDQAGQPVRPATGVDSLVDPAGPEPDGVTLPWDSVTLLGNDTEVNAACCWLRRSVDGWSWEYDLGATTPDEVAPWRDRALGADSATLVVAATTTDDGTRPPGRHHACPNCHGYGVDEWTDDPFCTVCNGSGRDGVPATLCPDCRGYGCSTAVFGDRTDMPCERCNGWGLVDDIPERDVTPDPDSDTDIDDTPTPPHEIETAGPIVTVAYVDAYRAGALAALDDVKAACGSGDGFGYRTSVERLRADIEAGRWPA